MWFKNLILYRFTRSIDLAEQQLENKMMEGRFRPCGKTEQASFGWVPPTDMDDDSLCYRSNGMLMVCARKQERILPSSVVKEYVDEKVAIVEAEQSRKVYKKERDAIKEEVLVELLPKAFTRQTHTYAYIDPKNGWMIVDASSFSKAEALTSHLRKNLGSLPLVAPALKQAPAATMTTWLQDDSSLPNPFLLGDECELRETAEEGGIIRCKRQDLTAAEITSHLEVGKQVSKLALSWEDSLSFVIQDDLCIKRLKFHDLLQDESDDIAGEDPQARFDADFTVMTLTLSRLLPQLLEALGGEDSSQYEQAELKPEAKKAPEPALA